MKMQWWDKDEPKISNIKAKLEGDKILLQFKWPNELEMLYVYRANRLKGEIIDFEKPYRKYTKSEYSNFGGIVDQSDEGGTLEYVLCPYIRDGFSEYLIKYKDECNKVQMIASQIEIRYEVQEKKKLFSDRKLVKMQIFCEKEIPKEYLCYVKKKGTIPTGNKDGMCFYFIDDFHSGMNILPEIEVDKSEHVRIYLTENVPFREAYRVIKD